MTVLIAYGSRRGGTAGLAEMIGAELVAQGLPADVLPADTVTSVDDYQAVVLAGSLYINRWHPDARKFARRLSEGLRTRPVWLVSSGPLDDSAATSVLPPVPQVARVSRNVGARGCVTFGGRLTPDARGFVAHSMAKTRAGDWRDPAQVKAFATEVADVLRPSRAGAES
ncbi:flavodoxin domain-containing protein [Hamadaea tsunoensis]|uniref:flavodoxin domain-containing protein n=1 Tax=Hamadaea tsunoensis TaxID=53368 RepID=UPI00041DEAE6|nr:flavodoxin domain-containing protein [Hamadaea tsunoensis]